VTIKQKVGRDLLGCAAGGEVNMS